MFPLSRSQAELAALAAELKSQKREVPPALAALGEEIRTSIREAYQEACARHIVTAYPHMRFHLMATCTCSPNEKGERIDRDGLPLWHKMEGCPKCDPLVYTPNIIKLNPLEARKS